MKRILGFLHALVIILILFGMAVLCQHFYNNVIIKNNVEVRVKEMVKKDCLVGVTLWIQMNMRN